MPAPDTDDMLNAVLRLSTVHMESARKPDSIVNHYAKHAPMLQQLRTAVGGNVKGGGGGGKSPNQRTPIDPDALDRYLTMVNAIRTFHNLYVGSWPDVEELPEVSLSHGYQAYRSAVSRGTVDSLAQRIATSWAQSACEQIEEKLSPPTRLELANFPCPNCGIDWVLKMVNKTPPGTPAKEAWYDVERLVAISIVYRSGDGNGMLSKSYALCSCCDMVWPGDYGIRFIAHEFGPWAEARELERSMRKSGRTAAEIEEALLANLEALASIQPDDQQEAANG